MSAITAQMMASITGTGISNQSKLNELASSLLNNYKNQSLFNGLTNENS